MDVVGGPGAVPGTGAGVCPGGVARPRQRTAGAGVGSRGYGGAVKPQGEWSGGGRRPAPWGRGRTG